MERALGGIWYNNLKAAACAAARSSCADALSRMDLRLSLIHISIDAGATAVSVSVERGGIAMIQIADHGCEMCIRDSKNTAGRNDMHHGYLGQRKIVADQRNSVQTPGGGPEPVSYTHLPAWNAI